MVSLDLPHRLTDFLIHLNNDTRSDCKSAALLFKCRGLYNLGGNPVFVNHLSFNLRIKVFFVTLQVQHYDLWRLTFGELFLKSCKP